MAIEVVIPKTKKRTLFMMFLCVTRYLKTLDIRKVLLISGSFMQECGVSKRHEPTPSLSIESIKMFIIEETFYFLYISID